MQKSIKFCPVVVTDETDLILIPTYFDEYLYFSTREFFPGIDDIQFYYSKKMKMTLLKITEKDSTITYGTFGVEYSYGDEESQNEI